MHNSSNAFKNVIGIVAMLWAAAAVAQTNTQPSDKPAVIVADTTVHTPQPPAAPEIPGEVENQIQAIEEKIRKAQEDLQRAEEQRERALELQEEALRRGEKISESHGDIIRIGSGADVAADEIIYGNIFSMGGEVHIVGQVEGDVVVIGGPANIEGKVLGSVVSVGGSINLGPDAVVEKDIVTVGGLLDRAEGAKVGGQSVTVSTGDFVQKIFEDGGLNLNVHDGEGIQIFDNGWGSSFGSRFVDFLQNVLATLLILAFVVLVVVFAPQRVENSATLMRDHLGRSFLFGIFTWIAFPFVFILMTLTCVGVIFIPFLAIFLSLFAYATAALMVGNVVNNRFSFGVNNVTRQTMLGVLVLELLSLAGYFISLPGGFAKAIGILMIIFGACLKLVLVTAGLGSILLSKFGKDTEPGKVKVIVKVFKNDTPGYSSQPETVYDTETASADKASGSETSATQTPNDKETPPASTGPQA